MMVGDIDVVAIVADEGEGVDCYYSEGLTLHREPIPSGAASAAGHE